MNNSLNILLEFKLENLNLTIQVFYNFCLCEVQLDAVVSFLEPTYFVTETSSALILAMIIIVHTLL